MNLKSNSEWVEWGRRDPLYGVASWEKKNVGGGASWTDEEFYALGESDWQDFEERWRKHGYTPGKFVEIGCGAGRITKQLSAKFDSGLALDVSEDMIRYASSHVNASNVKWQVTQGLEIPLPDNSVDAVFSCHVFQHFASVEAGYTYFGEVMRTLKPGGSFMIHLPIHMFPWAVSMKGANLLEFFYQRMIMPALSLRSSYKRFRMRHGGTPPMHGVSYEQHELYGRLRTLGFERVEFDCFPTRSNGNLQPFVMATKPSV
jgi:ubiquinone/menaquinone biosynthesis C-methylase UbiE